MGIKSEQGMTLIELLGAIAISAIIFSLVSSVFLGSVTNYNKTLTHSHLRQEANLVLAELTEVHHKNPDYEISIVDGLIQVTTSQRVWTIGNPNFLYHIPNSISINKTNDFFYLTLSISDPDNDTNPYEVKTIINRR
ncbi:prepilin-type N-terminal cleavage/methylation domain-containing protein [Cytobacillus oceanisediminis]|uniref:Prepilin-type N-terminal cleavage/methylation domain-containing protein n=1 Tax=Cytobacillus oceanisediminis TaxID=665099 RepID=A0A2V2ZI87_9BACI|nr:prepilin-type N-terminal cleavage/methylation domain-containing protein [Cytobacillus oceanisediminis]PWW19655.1 prepilin-type N-terminal cleavage/methylation domain-containing protein [Cytobacillus oceanisediminis]